MLTIKDLGQKLKREYPGKYKHLTAEQVGRAAKRRAEARGSHEYDDYKDGSLAGTEKKPMQQKSETFNTLLKDLIGDTTTLARNPGMEVKVNRLLEQMDSDEGWFSRWFSGHRTEKLNEVWVNLSGMQQTLIDNYMMLSSKVREGKLEEIKFKLFVANNVTDLMQIQAKAERIEKAAEQGITEPTLTELTEGQLRWQQAFDQRKEEDQHDFTIQQQKDQHEFDMWLLREKAKQQLELDKEQGFSDIKLETKEREAKMEWEKFKQTKDYAIQAAILSNLSEVAEIGFLTQTLLVTILTIQTTKALPDADRYIDQLEVFENNRKKLVELIDGRFQRVF